MWFVARVEGRKIKAVAQELGAYLPVIQRMTKPARKKQPVVSEVPLFPGWVFLRYSVTSYDLCRRTPGVLGVMKYGRQGLLFLKDSDIERIREIEGAQVRLSPIEAPVFHVGDQVEISGLLQGMTGKIISIRKGFAVVDVGALYPVTVDCCLLKAPGI